MTDSSPGSACYSSGNKAANNQQGVFPDDTRANFDNPRVEYIGEYFARTEGRSLGVVTTSDVFDATPGAWATHTQSRGAGTGICDQCIEVADGTTTTAAGVVGAAEADCAVPSIPASSAVPTVAAASEDRVRRVTGTGGASKASGVVTARS